MCVLKARVWPPDWQMPGPRAAQNLLMPHPRDWQGLQMPAVAGGTGHRWNWLMYYAVLGGCSVPRFVLFFKSYSALFCSYCYTPWVQRIKRNALMTSFLFFFFFLILTSSLFTHSSEPLARSPQAQMWQLHIWKAACSITLHYVRNDPLQYQ